MRVKCSIIHKAERLLKVFNPLFTHSFIHFEHLLSSFTVAHSSIHSHKHLLSFYYIHPSIQINTDLPLIMHNSLC